MTDLSDAASRATSLARVCEAVGGRGWAVEENFLDSRVVSALAADARRRDATGEFRAAGIGRGSGRRQSTAIRGDRITWLDEREATPATRAWWEALERLRTALNQALYLGLFSFEGHYAIYPPGASYPLHRDRFRDNADRVVSCVLYLNESWTRADGGALRIRVDDAAMLEVLPVGGTLACFLSDRFEHEVLPATRERLALSGWFRQRAV